MTKKIKVGILTTYFASNYGAMLQCYALKTALEQMDCDVEVIRYKQKSVHEYYNPYILQKFIGPHFRFHPYYLLRYFPTLSKRERAFRKFLYQYINPVKGYCDTIPNDKELYIVGSDQLWKRFLDGNYDPIYMGFFDTNTDSIKITYAVSGENVKFDTSTIEYLKLAFNNFRMVSMREDNIAQGYRDSLGEYKIDIVVDPTMLVDKCVYRDIPHVNPLHDEKFILYYSIRQQNNDFLKKIHQFAKRKCLKLFVLSEGLEVDIKDYARNNIDVIYQPTAGIDIFLGALKNAEYVFTPSFHGTVFSILFHKNFYNMLLDDGHDQRGINLLNQLKLSNQHLRINDDIKMYDIDFKKVDSIIATLRYSSIEYLKNAIKLVSHE